MKQYFIAALLLLVVGLVQAQDTTSVIDSTYFKTLNEVVVTATRTERKLGNVAVPVSIISQKQIQQAGTLRLKDMLQETTGLFITSGFGAGVQMQGLSADYTMILIDGEPLVGRTAGVLDLNRVSIGNIKKIEIVKGPSSSLYGSEAMAGVINIITDHTRKKQFSVGWRYGFGNPDLGWAAPVGNNTFKQSDFNVSGATYFKKLSIRYSTNFLYADAINYRPNSAARFAQPVWRITNQLQLAYTFSTKTKLDLTVRNGYDYIKKELAVANNGGISKSTGREINNDWNINPVLTHRFNDKINTSLRFYSTIFDGSEKLSLQEKPDSVYFDGFRQRFYRAENQTDFSFKKMNLTVGAGYIIDQARSTRYDNNVNYKQNNIVYGFVQHEWMPTEKISVIAGLRYDDNRLFAAAFSPKLAFRYSANSRMSFNASIGRGFKAPDFRQLYLNFTNISAGGYSVFGSIDAVKIINELQQRGEIAEIMSDFSKLSTLTPEYSTGINAGVTLIPAKNLSVKVNVFRNDIDGLIEVRQVATRINGTQIYSYINVKKAYTEGLEIESNWSPIRHLTVAGGYQLLLTADKEELKRVKAGKESVRDASNISRTLLRSEYVGLPNRSKHMANLKLTWENQQHFFVTLRAIYRSNWAVSNTSGNTVYDVKDEFAQGFVLFNTSAGKEFKNGISVQGGIDNILNYQDVGYLPNLQGRTIYAGIRYNFIRKQ